jgi:hypothetical protein
VVCPVISFKRVQTLRLLHLLFENGGSPPKISRFKVEGSLGGELRPIEALNFPR